jgi:hypothetical protein
MLETTKPDFVRQSPTWQPPAQKLGALWCVFTHDSLMWPIHGRYQCRACGRHYPVPWAGDEPGQAPATLITAASAQVGPAHAPSFRSALLPLVIMLAIVLTSSVRAADVPLVESTAGAGIAFARYIASLERARPWSLETVEIDAALPKLAKHGRLRAIRRLLPFDKAEYQVLEIAGDETVRQQVILRYLSAEVRAAAVPASSVAITPTNYKFHYKGSMKTGDAVAYAFQITPREKREGLIKGELWLDGETGSVVRESGYLVKKPSIFLKRVDVSREIVLRHGVAEIRFTHLSVDTRLVGRAELTIQERPYTAPDRGPALSIEEQ